MNGRCDNDPLDRAENICEKCGGDFCDACLLYPRGKKRAPICKACAIARSGVRSTSKSATPSERKNVRKRRKELKEQGEDSDNQHFIFFDEEGSDIVLRDPSVLEPEEEEAPTRRFGKKSKTKAESAKADRKPASKKEKPKKAKAEKTKAEKAESAKTKSKETKPKGTKSKEAKPSKAAASETTPSDLPPPPSSEDAIVEEDPDETIDLGAALSSYDISDNTEPFALEDNPFTDSESSEDDDDLTVVPVAEAPVDDTPVAGNDSPTATELLARLQEAENARKTEPEVSTSSDGGDPWIPTAMAEPTAASQNTESFDSSVNPFGEAPPKREPMEAWVPPTVTPDAEPLSSGNDTDQPSLDYAPLEFDDAVVDDPVVDTPGFLADQPFDSDQLFGSDDTASFKHDPAFETDVFDASDFEHDPAFAAGETASSQTSDSDPLEIIIHAPDAHAEHETSLSDLPFADEPDDSSSETGPVATATKADTDEEGNWVPPALRGMLPKEERENEVLPKRRDTD